MPTFDLPSIYPLGLLALSLWTLFAVEVLRALPWPRRWKERKPLSCDACLCFWTGCALVLLQATPGDAFAAAGGAYLLLAARAWLKPLPPG